MVQGSGRTVLLLAFGGGPVQRANPPVAAVAAEERPRRCVRRLVELLHLVQVAIPYGLQPPVASGGVHASRGAGLQDPHGDGLSGVSCRLEIGPWSY